MESISNLVQLLNSLRSSKAQNWQFPFWNRVKLLLETPTRFPS